MPAWGRRWISRRRKTTTGWCAAGWRGAGRASARTRHPAAHHPVVVFLRLEIQRRPHAGIALGAEVAAVADGEVAQVAREPVESDAEADCGVGKALETQVPAD